MRRQNDIIRILIMVFAGLIALLVIGGGIYLFNASRKLKALDLSPNFIESELEVGTQYSFSINGTPSSASIKKISCECDDPMCTFERAGEGKATLTTGMNEGTVTVYVEYDDIKSQVLTFSVVDSVARAQAEADAQAQAEAAAQAQMEAEAIAAEEEAEQEAYVKCIGTDVRVRAENNTDCDILGKADAGDVFEKVEEVDDWTHIIFQGQDAYMKTEFLEGISEEEAETAMEEMKTKKEEAKKEEDKKKEEKKEENTETADNGNGVQSKEEAEAKAKADAAAAEQAQAELLAQAQALLDQQAAAQAAQAATGTPIYCKDGTCYVTQAQLDKIHATWDFAGDAIEMAGHHNIGELEAVIGPTVH